MVRTSQNPGLSAVCSSLISQNRILKILLVAISWLMAVFMFTGVANASINGIMSENTVLSALVQVDQDFSLDATLQPDIPLSAAYADEPEPQPEPKTGISLESGPYIDITVYKDGSLGIPDVADKVKNIDASDGYFYSLEVSSDKQELNDAV